MCLPNFSIGDKVITDFLGLFCFDFASACSVLKAKIANHYAAKNKAMKYFVHFKSSPFKIGCYRSSLRKFVHSFMHIRLLVSKLVKYLPLMPKIIDRGDKNNCTLVQ